MSTQGDSPSERPTLSMGCGKPESVIAFYQDALQDHPDLVYDLQELRRIVTDLMQDDSGARIATSIACSVLNQQFQQTSVLVLCDQNGEWGLVHFDAPERVEMFWLGLVNR